MFLQELPIMILYTYISLQEEQSNENRKQRNLTTIYQST